MRHSVLCVGWLLPAAAFAQSRPQPPFMRPCVPCVECRTDERCIAGPQILHTSSRATLMLDGRVLRYEVTETFVNRGNTVGETEYLLPLPAHAAFEDLALSINGEMVTGETMRADRARSIYEEIVRRQRDPALVEWMGQGLLRTRIFPIAPGETKTVVARFRAVAELEGDALRIDYRPPMRRGDDGTRSTLELRYAARGEFGRAYSPTNDLTDETQGSLRIASVTQARGVVTLLVPVRASHGASVHVLAHADGGDDGFAMITISPPASSRAVTPRDITFVLDVSGSMAGSKLDQAKAAGRALLASLAPVDRFRVIAFSTDVREFRERWSSATQGNVREAEAYLNDLQASGSTNISGALETALRGTDGDDRLPLVLFLTDGEPTTGERQPDRIAAIAAKLRGRQRVFSFGVGTDVNAALLEQLALSGRGTAQFVRPGEDVERAVGIVARRLTNPVATDLRVRVDGVRVDRVQPAGTLDLFAGQELTVFARYHGDRRDARVTVEGTSAEGPVRWTASADFPGRAEANPFIARLWAVQRVGWLSAERRRNGPSNELDDELRALGQRYGIPTELTSYLVVEPGMKLASGVRDSGNQIQLSGVVVTGVAASMDAAVAMAPRPDASRRQFEMAKAAAEQRDVRTMAQLDRSQRQDGVTQQFVQGRVFTRRDGEWQDALQEQATATRVVRVRAFSEAYFALLQRLPALKEVFALGEKVSVQGRAVRLVLDPAGPSTLTVDALDQIVRDW